MICEKCGQELEAEEVFTGLYECDEVYCYECGKEEFEKREAMFDYQYSIWKETK